jgi:hypothetical protein
MKQWNLLSIKRIPMDIEVKVTPWKFEKAQAEAAEIQGGNQHAPRQQRNTPAPLPVINDFSVHDRFDFGVFTSSAQTYSPTTITGTPSIGAGNTGNGISNDLSEDSLVSKIAKNPIRATMASRPIESLSAKVAPASRPQQSNVINWSNGSSDYRFEADGADFTEIKTASDWKFVPHSVEVVIKQLPGVDIEYVGTPLYFPRSADPNYVPPEE